MTSAEQETMQAVYHVLVWQYFERRDHSNMIIGIHPGVDAMRNTVVSIPETSILAASLLSTDPLHAQGASGRHVTSSDLILSNNNHSRAVWLDGLCVGCWEEGRTHTEIVWLCESMSCVLEYCGRLLCVQISLL